MKGFKGENVDNPSRMNANGNHMTNRNLLNHKEVKAESNPSSDGMVPLNSFLPVKRRMKAFQGENVMYYNENDNSLYITLQCHHRLFRSRNLPKSKESKFESIPNSVGMVPLNSFMTVKRRMKACECEISL